MPNYLPKRVIELGKDQILYSGPFWDQDEICAATKAIADGSWLASGTSVLRFEREFSKRFSLKASLMVNSGSSANLIMLSAIKKYFDWPDQSEIIVSVVGFPTTVAPIIQTNMKPVFVDIELETLNFELDEIVKKITDKTKAILISPVLGNAPNMDALEAIADRYSIKLILDGCDSLGSKWRGRELSDYAIASSCSFYPAHHITTGEGGMVSSNNEELIKLARKFAWWGRDCYCVGSANSLAQGTCGSRFDNHLGESVGVVDHKYIFSEIGYNLKPLDLQGAIGLEQLKKFEAIHKARRRIKNRIGEFIKKHRRDLFVPDELPYAETSWFGVPIVCINQETKTKLVAKLEQAKIQTRNYFAGNLLAHPGYQHLGNASDYPLANEVLKRVFFIGCYPGYSDDVIAYIEKVLSE